MWATDASNINGDTGGIDKPSSSVLIENQVKV
jgi:hypothetical protein